MLASIGDEARLKSLKRLGKGTRRPLRLQVREVDWQPVPNERYASVSFVLPKGGYATIVIAQICNPIDPHTR
ncbi:MAG: hypothetical protein DRI90_22895 [Deltaproteobacteria bacterium]|nr:MAG: hypothetical protein DRI90_22895 [Deltaproteobacteria bacterium]